MLRRLIIRCFSIKKPNFDPKIDYYSILGVKQNASLNEIKNNYYDLAKKYHPDVNNKNEEMFKKINDAYQVIGNQEQKNHYDWIRSMEKNNQNFNNQRPQNQ